MLSGCTPCGRSTSCTLVHDTLQPVHNFFRRSPSGFITVEHHDDMAEIFSEKFFLRLTHRGTHERDARETSLRHLHAIEEALDENDGHLPSHPMQIKKFE